MYYLDIELLDENILRAIFPRTHLLHGFNQLFEGIEPAVSNLTKRIRKMERSILPLRQTRILLILLILIILIYIREKEDTSISPFH